MSRRRTFATAIHGLRSLDADCAPASCLRWSSTPALGTRAAPHGFRKTHALQPIIQGGDGTAAAADRLAQPGSADARRALELSPRGHRTAERGGRERSPRGDICRPGVLGALTAAAVPEPARAPLSPTSDNVSYVRFRPCSFPACFPQRKRPAPLPHMLDMAAVGVVAVSPINAPATLIGRRPDSVAAVLAGERRAAGRMAGERASVMRPAAQIVAAL